MKPNVFISYSRREVGFVDELASSLEKMGYGTWLDYRSLIPGTPWQAQILEGLTRSEVILLVVSKASCASDNVEMEWRHVLALGKRIILLIFEAVDIPVELQQLEWVDFRGSYKQALSSLAALLSGPAQAVKPMPRRGLKMPAPVWFALALSLAVAFLSLSAAWTLFIPWVLALLPYRIWKRSYNLSQTQAALLLLPVAIFVTAVVVDRDSPNAGWLITAFFLSIPLAGGLLLLLRAPALWRWGKEQASTPNARAVVPVGKERPAPVSFFVDYAPEDRRVAAELTAELKKLGHSQVESHQEAGAVFVLLSTYKLDTLADPESQAVFPVVLQGADIAPRLSKVQWIDFRSGVRRLDAIARLLPEPARMLRSLGIRPMGNGLVLPPIIFTMIYFLALIGLFSLGGFLQFFFQLFGMDTTFFSALLDTDLISATLFGYFLALIWNTVQLFFMARALIRRRGFFASFWPFSAGLLLLAIPQLWQAGLGGGVRVELERLSTIGIGSVENLGVGLSAIMPLFVYLGGSVLMAFFLLLRYRDVYRWFPAKAPRRK